MEQRCEKKKSPGLFSPDGLNNFKDFFSNPQVYSFPEFGRLSSLEGFKIVRLFGDLVKVPFIFETVYNNCDNILFSVYKWFAINKHFSV